MESRTETGAIYTINPQMLGAESGKDNKMRSKQEKLSTGTHWLESELVLDHTVPGQDKDSGAGKEPQVRSTLGRSLVMFTYKPNSSVS